MTLTIIEYGGASRQIECESFEFRCNQVTNWIEVRKEDGNKEIIYNICVIKALEQEPSCEDMGEVSDGYHTFNQLYHQRAILFATIVNQNVDKSWKSFKHEDGKYCFDRNGEWFYEKIRDRLITALKTTNTEEWIKSDVDEIYCSKCGCKLQDEQMYIPKNYCPNCGARMKEGEEE